MLVKPKNPEQMVNLLKSKQLFLYGFGGAGTRIAQWCDANGIDYCFVDRDADKKRKTESKKIIKPDLLKIEYPDANVVIASIIYEDEIQKELILQGVDEKNIISYKAFMPEEIEWSDLDNNADWELMRHRVQMFSEWIGSDVKSIADYGAGKMHLEEYLPKEVKYFPIDYIRRSDKTILCDLNTGNFPELNVDVTVCSAVLEFIHTAKELLQHICTHTNKLVIVSYVTLDRFPGIEGRRASAYVSDLTHEDIVRQMLKNGFLLRQKVPDPVNVVCSVYLFELQASQQR